MALCRAQAQQRLADALSDCARARALDPAFRRNLNRLATILEAARLPACAADALLALRDANVGAACPPDETRALSRRLTAAQLLARADAQAPDHFAVLSLDRHTADVRLSGYILPILPASRPSAGPAGAVARWAVLLRCALKRRGSRSQASAPLSVVVGQRFCAAELLMRPPLRTAWTPRRARMQVADVRKAYKRLALAHHPDKSARLAVPAGSLGGAPALEPLDGREREARLRAAASWLFKHISAANSALGSQAGLEQCQAALDLATGSRRRGRGSGARGYAARQRGDCYSDFDDAFGYATKAHSWSSHWGRYGTR